MPLDNQKTLPFPYAPGRFFAAPSHRIRGGLFTGENMAIKTKQHGNAVTITLDGEQYVILQRVADALNKLTWPEDAHDNTAESVCREFIVWEMWDLYFAPGQLAEGIVESIDTHESVDEKLEAARREEVRRVFADAGLLEGGAGEAVAVEVGEKVTP